MTPSGRLVAAGLLVIAAGVGAALLVWPRGDDDGDDMNSLAERYVRLVLAMGPHDPDYVDAYYGPPEWRAEVEAEAPALAEIATRAADVAALVAALQPPAEAEALVRLRHDYLTRQIEALRSRLAMLQGVRLSFDEESAALYDAVAPTHSEAELRQLLDGLEARLPGTGPLAERRA